MLFLLKRMAIQPKYDELLAIVVRAKTEYIARLIANSQSGDEGKIWIDPELVSCILLKENGENEVICKDFWEA